MAILLTADHRETRKTMLVALSMQKAILREREKVREAARLSGGGYDGIKRVLGYEDLAGLPVVKPYELMAPRGRMPQRTHRGMSVAAVNQVPCHPIRHN